MNGHRLVVLVHRCIAHMNKMLVVIIDRSVHKRKNEHWKHDDGVVCFTVDDVDAERDGCASLVLVGALLLPMHRVRRMTRVQTRHISG